jgi:hypothetical protein
MINSAICIDCICLPVCLSKTDNKILEDCKFFINALTNISYSIPIDDCIDIYFKNLDKTIRVTRASNMLYIQMTKTQRYILNFMDPKLREGDIYYELPMP